MAISVKLLTLLLINVYAENNGDSFATATEIQVGTKVNGVQEAEGTAHYYKFSSEGGSYMFRISGGFAELYDSSFNNLSCNGMGNRLTEELAENKVYYIKVYDDEHTVNENAAFPYNYSIEVEKAALLEIGQQVSSSIESSGDEDCYYFTPTEGGKYVIETSGNPGLERDAMLSVTIRYNT